MQGAPSADLALDVEEHEDGYRILANVPGVEKERIDVTVEADLVTISVAGPKEQEEAEGAKTPRLIHRERWPIALSRTLRLPDVSADGVDALLRDGVLTVTVKKDAKRLPKKITVN